MCVCTCVCVEIVSVDWNVATKENPTKKKKTFVEVKAAKKIILFPE